MYYLCLLFKPNFSVETSWSDDCDSRSQVFEFIAGPSAHVQWAFASYYSLYIGPQWVEYHLLQFTKNSSAEQTYVDVSEWERRWHLYFEENTARQRIPRGSRGISMSYWTSSYS